MTKIKLQIKNRWTGILIFEYEKENNTIKDAVLEALRVGADLSNADLSNADLSNAYLRNADLRNADLRNADLSNAYLRNADLSNADLSNAKEVPYIPIACPTDGAFIGWKKVSFKLVKLEIPEDALRCSATSTKCRCSKAKVLAITEYDGSDPINAILNTNMVETWYKVGEMVYPDSFDEDRWNECSHGIHFFINKEEAINY